MSTSKTMPFRENLFVSLYNTVPVSLHLETNETSASSRNLIKPTVASVLHEVSSSSRCSFFSPPSLWPRALRVSLCHLRLALSRRRLFSFGRVFRETLSSRVRESTKSQARESCRTIRAENSSSSPSMADNGYLDMRVSLNARRCHRGGR